MSIRGVELWWLHDGEHQQGHGSGRVTPDGVIVAAAFAVALVRVIGVEVAVVLRVAGVAHARRTCSAICLFLVVHRGQMIKYGGVGRGEQWLT